MAIMPGFTSSKDMEFLGGRVVPPGIASME
jgi:hypothetical protein